MTRIGVSAGFSSSSLPPARRCRRKLWTCPYRPGGLRHLGAPRSFAAVYRRRLPARATTVYNNTKATELTQAGNGGVRRATRPQRATYEAPANREEPSYSYFTGC